MSNIVSREVFSIDAEILCKQLKDQVWDRDLGSGVVNTLEWKAAGVIKQLLMERNVGETYQGEAVKKKEVPICSQPEYRIMESGRIYLSGLLKLYYTDDNGTTWQTIRGPQDAMKGGENE